MARKRFFVCVVIALLASRSGAASDTSVHAGDETRTIKALATADIDAYRQGKGMGLAKAAELNGYPGPRHVLDLSDTLGLSDEQIRRTEALFADMQARASRLGRQLIEEEIALDRSFASKTVTAASLRKKTQAIAALQAEIRRTHLQAHLAQIELLTREQIDAYRRLRGDEGGGHHPRAH